ncbi:hypothetical protein ACGF1Z_35055 [Streptomyces sp. NPDC048018]|uniref:hypothetical protein n=1 Tax=Streptomyces sp. NPDC048018 TaxID=3365499 RepID=UPI0037106BDB
MSKETNGTSPDPDDETAPLMPSDDEQEVAGPLISFGLPGSVLLNYESLADDASKGIRQVLAQTESHRRMLASAQRLLQQSAPDFEQWIQPMVDWTRVRHMAAGFQDIVDRATRFLPENWRDQALNYETVVSVLQQGIPLAWVPTAPIVRDLLQATDTQAMLEAVQAGQELIVESCSSVIELVEDPKLVHQAALLKKCVDMAKAGQVEGVQALAASVVDTLYRALWRAQPELQNTNGKWDGYGNLNSRLPEVDTDDSTILEFRQACVLAPLKAAYTTFNEGPVPQTFNRHATAHAAGRTQYTLVNALVVLMLAVSLLRELQDGYLPHQIHA